MSTAILVGDDIARIWAAAPGPSEETLAIMRADGLPPKVAAAAEALGIPLEEAAKIVAVASIPVRTV